MFEQAADGAFAGSAGAEGIEAGLDVGHGEALGAESKDALAQGFVKKLRGPAAAGRGPEEGGGGIGEAAEIAGKGVDGGGGAAESFSDFRCGEAFVEEGAQEFVAPLEGLAGEGEEGARGNRFWGCAHIRQYNANDNAIVK